MEPNVVHRLTDEQVEQLFELYESTYWADDRNLLEIRHMLDETGVFVGVCDQKTDELVGFARVLTDYVFRAFVEDVIVAETHRNEGFGRILMDALFAHPDLQQAESITLGCREDVVSFYERWGFEVAPEEMQLMNVVR
ncbi:GNAT family N-acetyltransferase [Haladaptatus sp. DFWS20]|uniref:GNAT family N-acetyltransferase n=1 Tax=Haladaptatus sp. DFWS20 TaxID=3403467 RepID=UPI003EBDC036